MHGGGQWLTLIALYGGNRAIVYCERRSTPTQVLDLAVARARDDDRHHRRRDGAPARGGRARANPIGGTARRSSALGNGGAMLSASVKAQLDAAFPNAVLNDSYGASETGAAGQRGRREHRRATGPRSPPTAARGCSIPTRSSRSSPARATKGCSRATRPHPARLLEGPAKTAATFRTDAHGVRWVVPGDWATIDDEGRIVLFGRGSGCINTGGEKVFPEEVEAAIRAHPDVFDAVVVGVPDDRFGQKVVALVQLRDGAPELDARRAAGALPRADRGLQGAARAPGRGRAPHQHGQARLRDGDGDRPRTPRRALTPRLSPSPAPATRRSRRGRRR